MTQTIFNRELQPCILVRLACIDCGPVRMALPPQEEPIDTLACPFCSTVVPAEPLGSIQTVRDLPFFHFEGQPIAERQPHQTGNFARLQPGQLLVYCEEKDILHLAALENIFTSRAHLSPAGIPSVTFIRNGEETAPVPHISGSDDVPPYWCTVAEARAALKPAQTNAEPSAKKTNPRETRPKTNQKQTRGIKNPN